SSSDHAAATPRKWPSWSSSATSRRPRKRPRRAKRKRRPLPRRKRAARMKRQSRKRSPRPGSELPRRRKRLRKSSPPLPKRRRARKAPEPRRASSWWLRPLIRRFAAPSPRRAGRRNSRALAPRKGERVANIPRRLLVDFTHVGATDDDPRASAADDPLDRHRVAVA